MARETKEEKAAKAAAAREAEQADRERTERELAEIKELTEENGRPPTKDELATKRAARATAEADRALETEMGGHKGDGDDADDDATPGAPAANGNSGSIAERAATAPTSEGVEDDGQGMFVWEQGRKVTLATLIARGTKVEHAFVFGGKRTKGTGDLMGFDARPLMIVSGRPGAVKLVPTYTDDDKVEKVVIESHVNAVVVKNADSDEGLALIGHIMEQRGWRYVGEADAAAAS